jgi:hypothetical protein
MTGKLRTSLSGISSIWEEFSSLESCDPVIVSDGDLKKGYEKACG